MDGRTHRENGTSSKEALVHMGTMGTLPKEEVPGNDGLSKEYANSFLKSGHVVRVNNELAKIRKFKEAGHQLPAIKTNKQVKRVESGIVEPRQLLDERIEGGTKPKKGRPETVGFGRDDSGGPTEHGTKPGQGMRDALNLVRRPNDLKVARETFKKKFVAKATLLAKNAKRRKIMEIMENICGKDPFPVDQEKILSVATALDEAKLQSGDQYMHEVKLMHIEEGQGMTGRPLSRDSCSCARRP